MNKLKNYSTVILLIVFLPFVNMGNASNTTNIKADKIVTVAISSGKSTATIKTYGSELKSFNVNGNDIVWQSNPKIWSGSAPVLFPIVGKLKNGEYTFQGKTYKLGIHGFASTSQFRVIGKTKNSVTLGITSTEKTKKVYPFDFDFRMKFSIKNNILYVKDIVENTGNNTMYFSVGNHPAINLPLKNTAIGEYYIEFAQKETLYPLLRDRENQGLLKEADKPILNNQQIIHLNKSTIALYPIELHNIKSRNIFVKNDKTGRIVKVNIQNAPDLGIWAAKGGNYVCIEPWFGHDDLVKSNGKLKDKAGILSLKPGKTFATGYSIELIKS